MKTVAVLKAVMGMPRVGLPRPFRSAWPDGAAKGAPRQSLPEWAARASDLFSSEQVELKVRL